MPLYEYVCTSCKYELEALQKMADKPLKKCPQCKKQKLKKQMSTGSFVLKGIR